MWDYSVAPVVVVGPRCDRRGGLVALLLTLVPTGSGSRDTQRRFHGEVAVSPGWTDGAPGARRERLDGEVITAAASLWLSAYRRSRRRRGARPQPQRKVPPVTPYEKFQAHSRQICRINEHLAQQLGHGPEDVPVHRMNDAYLIVFHVFAFEEFCRRYVPPKPRNDHGLTSGLLKRLADAICGQCGRPALDQKLPDLQNIDRIFLIRHMLAHCFGRRTGLNCPNRLPTDVLKAKYGFETDDGEKDPDARWWPQQNVSFSACVGPLMSLAQWVRDSGMKPTSGP